MKEVRRRAVKRKLVQGMQRWKLLAVMLLAAFAFAGCRSQPKDPGISPSQMMDKQFGDAKPGDPPKTP